MILVVRYFQLGNNVVLSAHLQNFADTLFPVMVLFHNWGFFNFRKKIFRPLWLFGKFPPEIFNLQLFFASFMEYPGYDCFLNNCCLWCLNNVRDSNSRSKILPLYHWSDFVSLGFATEDIKHNLHHQLLKYHQSSFKDKTFVT